MAESWISRSTAIAQIKSNLKGYPASLVSTVIAQLNLPARLAPSEATAYYRRASNFASDYSDIRSGTDPRVHTGTNTTFASGFDAGVGTYGAGTPSAAASAGAQLKNFLIQPFIDGGWRDPVGAANFFWNDVDRIVANVGDDSRQREAVRSYLSDVVRGIAARFGDNESAGRSIWRAERANLPSPPIQVTTLDDSQGGDDYGFNPYGFGSSGGGGYAGPEYVKPDRRVVEDAVRGELVVLVGRVDDLSLQTLTDLYMSEHRRDFDSPSEQIDPRASVRAKIREREDFKRIHELRPDFVDEEEWVTVRQEVGLQAGLDAKQTEQFAINQATVGTAVTSLSAAAATTGFAQGNKTPEFVNRAKGAASRIFQGVR